MTLSSPLTCRIIEILTVLQKKTPGTDLIALAVLPRANYIQAGQQAWPSIFTPGIQLINDKVKDHATMQSKAHFLDCGQRFIVDGHVGPQSCCDFCFLSASLRSGLAYMSYDCYSVC